MSDSKGIFCWRELMTTDAERARGFYGELFNWKSNLQDLDGYGTYTFFAIGEKSVAGAAQLPDGIPSHWLNYITVNDVEAAVKQVVATGGQVLRQPFDIPGIGRAAFCKDPSGAGFAAFQGLQDSSPSEPGDYELCWSELMTPDLSVTSFYARLFGWTVEDMGPDAKLFKRGDVMTATARQLPQEATAAGVPAHWLNFVAVPDAAESYQRAQQLGAAPRMDVTEVPGMGRFTVFADPTGATLALWTKANQGE